MDEAAAFLVLVLIIAGGFLLYLYTSHNSLADRYNGLATRNGELSAENEKLKAELAKLKDDSDPEIQRRKVEAEKQRAALADAEAARIQAERRLKRVKEPQPPPTHQDIQKEIAERVRRELRRRIAGPVAVAIAMKELAEEHPAYKEEIEKEAFDLEEKMRLGEFQ